MLLLHWIEKVEVPTTPKRTQATTLPPAQPGTYYTLMLM